MKLGLFAIKDELKGFGPVSLNDNDQEAYRAFAYTCNSTEIMKMNVKDYSLYKVGVYDTELGLIDISNCPKLIVDAASCVRKEK